MDMYMIYMHTHFFFRLLLLTCGKVRLLVGRLVRSTLIVITWCFVVVLAPPPLASFNFGVSGVVKDICH